MTLTDYTLKNKGPPEWIEEDQIVSVQGRVGEDIIVEMKLALSENYDDLRFELIKDGLPISTDRYQLSMRGNIVQLALNQSRKTDAGYYSLIATRLGQENNKGALKKIHLNISETSYEEGDPPVFLRRLSDLAVKVGTRTRFLIEIRSSTSLKITWYKDDTPIYDGARFSLVHEGNFHCVDVAPVRIEDQGCWTCMAENHSGRSSCTSTLTVIVPKAYKKPEFVEELRALLTETGTVSLECKVIGVPTPILRWFKDNKEIKAGDVFALTANPDDPTSLGVYTCEAVNCMGTAYSSSKVHVVGRGSREGSLKPADALTPSGPLPIFKQILQDECCRIGDTILLSCRVQVPPWPKAIAWYNKEGRIEPNEKYHVIEDGIGGYSIEIKQVEAMDEGEWKCVATSEDNMKQFTSCYVAMSIPRNYRKPRFMENLKAVLTEEGLVSFECKVVGFPTPLLRWFKDGQELKPGDVYQLTGTNSLGSYCCIARNCMGEAKSTAELTIEDIQNQLNEEERFQLLSTNQPPKFIKGLRSCEAKINEDFRFTVQVSVAPEPTLSWYRDDALMDDESDKYHIAKENLGTCHFEVRKLEFVDQAEWKCVAANDFGHSVTSCFLKLIIPKHYKKPKFLESLRAILSEEGAVNLECKVIGVPQPVLKWYKDNVELKPGDIHRIISGQDGTCCLGIYTCEATNCMGTVSSSASLLGFENRKDAKEIQPLNGHELARNLSLSTIHEERTSQLYDTPQTDHSVTLDERGEVSFSFDGKEVSVSLYETPDLTEEEALQIVEMYADQLSEHVTEHNVIELPPMRFVKETSTTGNLLMEAVVIDVSPDYFVSAEDGDDLRTEADFEDVSIMDDVTHVLSSPERDSRSSLKRSARYNVDEDEKVPNRPPRKKSMNASLSKSERSQQIESESFHSVQKDDPPLSPLSSLKQDDSDTFADALSSAHLSITESLVQKNITSEHADNRKRSLSAGRSTGSSLDDGIGGDSSFDSMTGVPKKMQRKKKQRKDKSNSEKYSDSSDEQRKRSESEDNVNTKIKSQPVESVYETEMDNKNEAEVVKELLFTKEKLDFQDNLKSVNEINSHVSKETKKSTEDILSEPRIALHKALELFHEKLILNAHTAPLFSDIYEQIDNIYQILETSKGIGADIEILTNLEIPLHTLLKKINEIISIEYVEIIHDILQPSIVQLSHAIEKLESSSLQPTFVILKNFSKLMCNISSGSEKLSSTKSISDESQNISEEIVDSLLDIQSTFSEILQQMEQSKLSVNKSGKSQQISITSELMACLIELRECVSHTAHTAMALKENETLSSLMEFRKPLLDLQLILSANRGTFYELSTIKEINIAVAKLKSVIVTILNDSTNRDVIFQIKTIFKILEDTDKQILKLVEQSSEMKIVQKRMLKNLDIEQSLSKVHFALSSVLEKQHIASSHLITSIEVLRQTIGSSAVTIANLNNPVDNEITQEISTLNESLLNLQRNLLTEKHELEEEQILDNLMHPIGMLKAIIHNIIENSSSVQLILPMLELLEDIEKDIALVTKEISKRKYQEESITQSQKENTVEESNSKSILATLIRHSLDPIKNWLSVTSDDSTKDEMKSTLSSTIEELKKDITQIAIQTSYSEVPNDESLIKALIDLREPLMRLNTAMSVVDYGPEDISVLENLNCPMKYLLQTIMSVLHERAQEKSLRPIINIIKQIENQIPLSIKDALYQQELKQNAKALNIEMGQKEEETVSKISKETIPGTLTEVATIPFEIGSTTSFTEQATTENNFDRITDDVQTIKNEKQEREKDAGKLIIILLETLEKLQLEITSILEDFEESITQTTTIPQSKLANFLEDLRSIISTIYMTIIHSEETSSLEEKFNQTTLVLINLMQPLTNIRNLLSRSHEHDVSELIILNRFSPLLDIIEINVIRQIINFVNKDENVEKNSSVFYACCILERMSDLEKAAEETLETDVANILGKPINSLLKDIKIAIQEVDALDRREPLILELRNFIEPLLEFHSCLSMVQNSRKSLVPEASLLEERRSVILRAVDGLQKQVCHTVEIIANMEDAFLFNESLTLLNSAILQVQKQVDKTDYSRRSSSTQISLQHRLTGTLSRLAKAIIALQEHTDKDTYGIVSKCLEALQKQISFSQTQFNQINNELIDEEAIIEGFLYPANQLLSALNILKENIQKQHLVISHSIVYFQELADSITELSFSLSAYKTELVREGTSEGAPIVETFSAVIDVLGHIKDSVTVIEKAVDNEQKASMIITKVESVTDEIIEVSQEEIENIMMITEIPSSKAIVQEAQSEIGGTPITTQISILENLETVQQTSVKQMKNNNLTDSREYEENQKENERKEHLIAEISKFNCAINNLIQPLRELINLVKSTKQKSLVSKSEENKRKIQELTALIQVLNDLQATNASITTVISSSSVILLDSQFSCMKAILSDLEQAVGTVISLTHEGVRPELKENIMTSLQFIGKPLDSLENILASIYQTIDKDRYIDKDRELSEVAQTLISCINDTVKSLNEMQISKCLSIADDKENEMEISEVKEEMKNIEEITARPLEELIEAIMDSQEIKCDKTSESDLSFMNTIESKDIDNLKSVESQLNETLVKKMDDSAKRDKVDTPQVTSLPESDQAEKLFIKNTGMIKTITQSLEKVEEQNLATIDKQEIEPTQISENNIILEKQIKVETLRTIISPLQVLRKSFDQIGEIGVFESSDKKAIAFSALIEPLLNLEFVLPEVTEDIKQDTVTLQGLSVVSILDEVQRSVATIQEEMQLQLNAMAETSLNKTPKILLAQAIMKPLGDLRISIARIQSDPMINQFVQQGSELSNVEQITILQNLVKSVTQFGERFTSIVNQIEIEATLPLQTIKQTDQQLDLEVLHKIVNPIHVLRETLSQIENLNNYEAEVLEIPKQKITTAIVQLTAVMDSLEKLEQSLIISTQQIIDMREKITKELNEDQNLFTSMNLKPILEELRNSITIVQEQIIFDEDIPALKTLTEALENLKMPLITVEEVIDHSDKVTEIEKIATLLSFAKSVENTANQLMAIAKRDMAKQEVKEISLIKTMTIPIEELQSAILKLEDQVSQTLETKGSIKTVSFECMVQPLQELQQLFLTSSYQETALFLQELPLKPILDNLNKSVAVIQDQITLIQNVLIDGNTDDSIILKDFAKSLGNLRTSTVVLQQLNAIENAGQQIVEIENASALQAFAKSIEEFKKSCSVIVERPRIIEALTKNIELKQLNKIDAQLIENIVAPLRILQEQILTIEESKMQESEILDLTEVRKPITVLSSLVSPLQQLEKSLVATVQKQHVIEHDGHNLTIESSSVSLEKLALQPVLEEVQKSIATVQEHMILEAGKQIPSEIESDTLLKSIAQPLVDLKASIASIQQVTAIAPDFLTELAQEQNVSTLETFAKILHNLTECMAMCNQQQVIMEPAADTISEDALSLNTWADVIDEAASKITHPMVIDQGVIESPTEIAMSMSEEEMSSLRTLAKPLTELRECLALIVEEQKTVPLCDTTCVLSEKENISLTKTMIQPLLELKQAAAIIIQEQMAIECTNEHSFVVDGKNEFTLRCLVEPLEELRHSIAIIQDQMLIETLTDQSKNDIILNALAEPLFDIQRAISILETRVMSPDVESMSEDVGNNWITECLATPLHEIERSIAEIRQCDVMEPKTTIVEEKSKTLMPDRSIIEKLIKPVESIKSTISRMENDSTEIEVLKTIEKPLANVRENLMLLTDKYNLSAVEKKDVHAFIESLFNLEERISFIKKEIIDKPMPKQSSTMKIDTTISVVNIPLTELKYSIAAIKDSPSLHLQNLEKPLELVQNVFETICIIQIQEKPNTVNLMTHALESLEKSISLVQEQSADKPLEEKQEKEINRTQQEHQREREVEMIQKEIDEFDNEVGITKIKRNEEHKNLKKDKKLEKEQENFEDEKCAVPLNQNKNKIEELRKEKEDSNENKKQIQKKIEVQQKEVEDAKKQERELNNKETIEKVKEERDKTKRNEEIIKLKKEIKDTNKKEEKMKEEKQKKKDEDKILMNKENKESTKAEEIKIIKEEQTEIKRNIQEKEEKITQERDKVAEKVKEKEMSKRKEEIDKTGEIIQQAQCEYVNGIKKRKYLQMDENKKKQNYKIIMLQSQQEESKSKLEEKLETLEREEEEEQHKLQHDQSWSYTKKWVDKNSERWIQKDEDDQERDNKKQHRMEMERLEKKRIMRRTKQEADYISILDEENRQKRNEERKIRRDETTRLLWEKEQRLRKRQEEEIFRNRQRRKEQIKENEWSRKRENESDRFLRNMLETTYKSTPMFFNIDYSREYSSRFDSSVSILSSISRSYSWRDSLTSLSGKKVDDYWNYKLRSPVDKYYFDTSLSYRRRRKRENRMIRARSTSLLKYEDYSTGDSDATIVPSTNIRSFRRTKAKTASRIDFDACESNLFRYTDLSQNKYLLLQSFPWEKLKKPSFCTRLTNRIVGVGMRIRLTCTVLGNPEPRVYWTKDNQKLAASNKRCRMRYENGMAYLELDEALLEDAGIYTCVAENTQGTSITESILSVYSDYKPMHSSPIFVKSIKDTYRYSDRKLILECRVRSYPVPIISWLKDGVIIQGERYKQSYLDDDVYRLEIADPDLTDNGQYTCRAANELYTEEISHIVHVEDWQSVNRNDLRSDHETKSEVERKPRFSNLLKDYNVPAGGTIALQVEVKGVPAPEVKWLRGDRKEPITIPQARTFAERGLYTLIVPEATESERGIYVCRAINAYGQVDTSATVDVISSSTVDGGKPAVFVSRPFKKSIDVIVGEDISISFRVSGIPKPRIIWMKGLTDITDGPRSYKESIDDYVRLTLKRVIPSDEGTYCILVKNRYGCDRSFFSIKIKQRARSLTPLSDWNSVTERDAEEYNNDMSYVRNVPGPISSEPVAIDGGKSWLSLSWGKAERRGPAPVIAYKVEAWLLGGDGGARWVELGITPINAFDAFNLRPGGEYKFRVTPRNRYGWGEPVTMTNSVMVSESTDLPEFTKILPGQLKALEGMPVKLECEIRSDSKVEVRWYRETMEINPCNNSRFAIHYNGSKYSLTIANIREDDSGRYVCEANNRMGKVSSFARILVVTDPRIIEADAKLKTSLSVEPEDRPPQFTMRIRDRRVQTTYPVRLTCQVIGHPIPEVTWYKNETEISQDERHVFWDDDSNFHTLEIIHSTLEDSGCYMVTARNINGSVSCRCNLVVDKGIRAYIAPEFLRDLNAVYTIPSGRELRMSAQLEAYPSVGVVWHRDGIRLRPSRRAVMTLSHDGTIQFSLANITARDAGIYSCTATNVVGQTETSTRVAVITTDQNNSSIDESSNVTSTDIPYSKEPLFVTKPLSTEAIEGDTVIILCEVVGDPKPEVIWLRDFLKPDYYKDAPHFRLVGAGPQYRLEIPYAKLDFTGTYSVIARNCHGEAKAVISLQIYAKGQGKEEQTQKFPHGKILTLPIIKRELQDLRCCDGDAVSLECKVYATPEPPLVRWERGGKIIVMMGDFAAEFNGETARLSIQHVYPEDEGEYTCVAYNDLGKAYTSACLVVDVPEGKENTLSQRLTRPMGLLSAGSTPRSTPRSTPIRSLSPAVSHGREFRSPQVLSRSDMSKRPKVCPPKFYAVPHNRLVQEGETVRFQCAVIGHPAPWVRWDKNGTVVTPSARISIKERDDIKILEIIDVMREDAALYRVIAENDFGRIEASARLEVINRYETTSRTIRTRSASPRTHPIFDRSLLPTTSRINSRLQLECRVRGTPSVTPTWYRNGRPLERSSRIKRYFDGTTARMEISKIKGSDAGEYTCIATNILGSTRSTCEVTVLDPYDPSFADKTTPQFLRSLPEESIVMENHCHEFQTGVIGTPPFTITWYKDGRELPDNDYYKYIVYEDGGVALRLSKVRPQDAGEYTCIVRNDFGIASCSNLFAVQDYKNVSKLALQFTKTPLSVTAAKGTIACFCARVQCEKTVDIIWTINGKDARESTKCKIERNSNVSILRIRDVSLRDTGVIRCTASINRKGPAISCIAKLQLQNSFYNLSNAMTKPEDIQIHAHTKLSLINTNLDMLEKITELSSLKCWRRREKSLTHIESSSFSRRAASYTKHVSPLPRRKQISNNVSNDTQTFRIEDDLSVQRIITKNLDTNLEFSKSQISLSSLNEEDINDTFIKLSSVKKTEELYHQAIDPISNNEYMESYLRGLTKATIIKEPTDISVIKGSAAVLRAIYQGYPEPTIKWFQVNRELRSGEKIGIVNRDGVSRLTLDDVTYDHAGKYEISVENSLGKDRRFFSLAVEGPPEPLADKPSVKLSDGQTTIVWRSPPYDGGRTLIGYTVEARRASESTWTVIAESCHSLSHTVATTEKNSVIPGESYYFRIRAENIHGLSDPSMESELVRILREGKRCFKRKTNKSEPSFEPRIVIPEEGKFFGEKYDVLEELGKGRYGVVKKVIERLTGVNFAAKFVRTIKTKDREQVREEIKIMNALRHPKLLLLVAAYEYPRETVLITEYISGGELFERVVADDFILTERDSILFMRQICQGVEYMHQNKIVHLDLKPENIMCCTRTSHQIKLIDFGLAQTLKSDTPIRVLFGTPEFIPPEIINYEPIGIESDMWSVGVICYVLLTGLSPFMGDNDAETFANITRADYDLEDKAFDAISNDAKNFISGLLIKRKDLRMSATQCLEHPWMVQHTAAMSRVVLPTEKLKKFIIRRKWQKTGNAIRALGRMAILSAYSRRSPTTTAESSPTLEQSLDNIEIQYSDGIESISNTTAVDIETENIEMSTKENFTKIESQTNLHSTRVEVTEANVTIQKTSTKEKNNLNTLSKQINIEKEIPEMESGIESMPKIEDIPQNVTSHLEILVSNENKKSNEEIIDKFSKIEQYTIPKPQTFHRIFRGNSHDSGIDDCNSNLVTSPLQIDELGIVSTIKKEIDHETRTREGKQTLKKDENQQNLTAGILINLVQGKKTHLCDTEIIADNDKVAMTKSDMTKALCETNYIQKVADENADTRILSGHNRDKFLPTGNVSRTARIFETESATSNSSNSQVSVVQRAAIITGKPYNERIQKVFAFWNK
ncbi:titin-like [Pogonomyrmex barbatus]|uniref:Titin-like n=1 Tax=Pogonomyrmex barbatus TaxID=144034 RepID=A0A6I9WLV1_9HYME|nr:titin-like [Pogonomyrmex barbatus]